MGSEDDQSSKSISSLGPDTEPTAPLEPESSGSVDVSFSMTSSERERPTLRDGTGSHELVDRSSLVETTKSPGGSHRAQQEPAPVEGEGSSHTTMQSMMRPDLRHLEAPHSRRILSLENDMDEMSVNLRLLEKSLISAQKEARIAWILATAALLAGAVAIAL